MLHGILDIIEACLYIFNENIFFKATNGQKRFCLYHVITIFQTIII